jgi:hypothetical protein
MLLVGVSAGGFGAVYNYDQVAQAFPNQRVVLLNDSGTLLEDDEAMTVCLQLAIRLFFNIDSILPPDCADCFNRQRRRPGRNSGLSGREVSARQFRFFQHDA